MDKGKIATCQSEFNKLLKKTLYSYPFYEKADEELISDAISRDQSDLGFGLFKLGSRRNKEVPARGNIVEMKFIPLFSLESDKVSKFYEVKSPIKMHHYYQ